MINEKNFTITLPGTKKEAVVHLERKGQQLPHEGDKVVVRAVVKLPCGKAPDHDLLLPEITFGRRVSVCGERLDPGWGYPCGRGEPFRYKEYTFVSEKWSSAFNEAEEWACNEVKKLVDALVKRLEALKEAED